MLKPLFGLDFGAIPIYAIMLFVAVLSAFISMRTSLKKLPFSDFIKSRITKSYFFAGILGVAGANLSNRVIYPELNSLSLIDSFLHGGYSFYFGMLTFFGAAALFLRLYKIRVGHSINLFVPSIALAQFFARIGCSLAGCCYGITLNIAGSLIDFPARELEAVFALIMFISLNKVQVNKRLKIYILSYSVFRFVFDFLRGDKDISILGTDAITVTQITSLIAILVVSAIMLARPIAKLLKCEDSLNDLLNKNSGKNKKYTPLPVNYVEPAGTKHIGKTVMAILIPLSVVFVAFIIVNPFNASWCEDIKYFFDDKFSFVFSSGGTEETIGDTDGVTLLDITNEYDVTDEKTAIKAVKNFDTLTAQDFKCIENKELPNGSKLYVLNQTIDGKPVYGKNKVLIVGADTQKTYIAGDAASLSFAKNKKVKPLSGSVTIKEAFGKESKILKKTDCWYDTGDGLVDSYHASISIDGKTASIGAIISKKDDKIICLTKLEINAMSSIESNNICTAIKDIIDLAADEDAEQIKNLSKKKKNNSTYEEVYITVKRALCLSFKNTEISCEQFKILLSSVYEICRYIPNLNMTLLRDIITEEHRQMLIKQGYSDDDTVTSTKKIKSAFSSAGIKEKTDEKAVTIFAEKRKSTYRHTINYCNDTDIFNIISQANSSLNITVDSDNPVLVSVINKAGKPITSIYADGKETITLYPEDGTEFFLQIADQNIGNISYDKSSSYKLTVKSDEQKNEIPREIVTTISKIEESYNTSNAATFLAMVAIDGEKLPIEQAVGLGLAAPILDSCEGCMGMEDSLDTAKLLIAEIIVPETSFSKINFQDIHDSSLEMSYEKHISKDDYIILKAKVRLSEEGYDYYNGYTYLKLKNLKNEVDYSAYSEQEQETLKMLHTLFGNEYTITETNHSGLYSLFGDSDPTSTSSSDIDSMYELCSYRMNTVDGVSIYEMVLDEEKALLAGHSEEKIDSFKKYVLRNNISTAKSVKASLEFQQDLLEGIGTYGDPIKTLYDAITNPVGTLADIALGDSELWTLIKFIMDPVGTVTDELISEVFRLAGEEAKKLQPQIDTVNEIIEGYNAELETLRAKAKTANIFYPIFNNTRKCA